ncbi:30S ribosomal protein S16 [Candidatus Fermentibacteria bacterium]|nr:30S ribosomal protein S16 [Candidatus Fermentibacteria bacterium]
MRMGRRHAPTYRIVAIDSRMRRDGRFLEIVGHYNPRTEGEPEIVVKDDRVKYWLGVGAQPSETVRSLFRRSGLLSRMDQERKDAFLREALERRSIEEQQAAEAPQADPEGGQSRE